MIKNEAPGALLRYAQRVGVGPLYGSRSWRHVKTGGSFAVSERVAVSGPVCEQEVDLHVVIVDPGVIVILTRRASLKLSS
jgi:hypothetical protein